MEALFTGENFPDDGQPESVVNILSRFQDIEDGIPEELAGDALPYFADWLIENVHLVEITAYSDADAYTIFETMNDRGLSLTPTSTMQYNMFQLVILGIRGKPAPELATILTERLAAEDETFTTNDRFRLHGMNGRQIHRLLARMPDYIKTRSGQASRYAEYIQRRGNNGYEVEHVWANHPQDHEDEFAHPADFAEYRNRIGGLLLLPKSFNASDGDKAYAVKREHYYGQNLLAQSLHEKAYEHNPGFLRFRDDSSLPFAPHAAFKKADLDARQDLYRHIAEQIWNPENLSRELDGEPLGIATA